jgi:hypothetical protein
MTDDEILVDLETFNDAMVQFKEAVDGKGRRFFLFKSFLYLFQYRFRTNANDF